MKLRNEKQIECMYCGDLMDDEQELNDHMEEEHAGVET